MSDPSRDLNRIAEVLRCKSSSLALSLEEPEATLIDSANQAAFLLKLSATIFVVTLLAVYPYPFFLRETTKFSRRFISHRLVSPIRLLVLGRTYGTYLHYERSYV